MHIDILRASLPIIRADYRGLETYTMSTSMSSPDMPEGDAEISNGQDHSVFHGRMTVWGGADDLLNVSEESLAGWREHQETPGDGCCVGAFSCKVFPGSHFYFGESEAKEEFIAELSNICFVASIKV